MTNGYKNLKIPDVRCIYATIARIHRGYLFIDREGQVYPPDGADLIREANSIRYYVCTTCLQLIEVQVGVEAKHDCPDLVDEPQATLK